MIDDLKNLLKGTPWGLKERLELLIEKLEAEQGKGKPRTLVQNSSLHLYLSQLADTLNEAGLDMKKVITVDIDWNLINAKEYLWRPVQKALFKKQSTTELTKSEVSEVYEHLNRLTAEKWGIHIPFPSQDRTIDEANDMRNQADKLASELEAPDEDSEELEANAVF